jgi:hypothetical protein
MIASTLDLVFGVSLHNNALINGKNDISRNSDIELFEGDTQIVRVYLRKGDTSSNLQNAQLGVNEKLVLAISERSKLSAETVPLLAYAETFDQGIDSDGDSYYEGLLQLNTQDVLDALQGQTSLSCIAEAVIIDTSLGRQFTLQGRLSINKTAVPPTALSEINDPSLNIGSYATVEELINTIVDGRILGLKDGTPVEFDTLYELAEVAMEMQSFKATTGDFNDYLEGKALADSGLTISQLNSIVAGEASVNVEE